MTLTFTGHRVMVLGGTCALALDLAKRLMANGLCPLLTYRNEEGRNQIRTELVGSNGTYDTVHLDLSEPDSIDKAFDSLDDNIDYLVDFAHGHLECLIGSGNMEKVEHYFRENITGRTRVLKRAARVFVKKKRGRLVYVSSAAAVRSNPGQGFYAASKLASEALYRNLGIELADRGITTVSLRLGYVEAGRGKAFLEGIKKDDRATQNPLAVEAVSEAIMFHLSKNATGFNATEIRMDNGRAAAK